MSSSSMSREEPRNAPQSDRWYNLTLGPSFKPDSSNKYCTLRYEFKPASIDKTKSGTLHKKKDNRVSVEFQNNQLGKPKVAFEGSSEDYKDNDAVLFFDGHSFRLERLHRAVKQLRHIRLPGESANANVNPNSAASSQSADPKLSPVGKVGKANASAVARPSMPPVPVEVERIDIGEPQNLGARPISKGLADQSPDSRSAPANSPGPKNYEADDHQDIDIDELFGSATPENENNDEPRADLGFDSNNGQNDSDDEIADVDDSDDDGDRGPNAAEALRAQLNADERDEQTSSSSSSSGSGSVSGSSSSSGDSEGSDDETVNSI